MINLKIILNLFNWTDLFIRHFLNNIKTNLKCEKLFHMESLYQCYIITND